MTDAARLTAGATLARGTAWNIAGRVGPLLLALLATPFLVDALGLARWGVFALGLSLAAMFAMVDLGIGRALTRLVAARLGTGGDAAGEVMAGLALLALLGVAGGVAAGCGAWVLAPRLGVAEAPAALAALALSAPLVLVNAGLWGVLAAHQRFAAANLVNLPILAVYYLGPLAALWAWDSLVAAMLVLVACRAAMTLAYWRLCRAAMPGLAAARVDWGAAGPLLRQGGWLAVAGLVAPLAQHLDRFVIAARLSVEAAALYATPFDLVIRIAVLGQAVLAGGFPAMATALQHGGAGRVFRHALLAAAALVAPPCLVAALFAETILGWWLGADFASGSAGVMRWLALGVVFAAVDGVAAALIDSAGRARRNALLGLAELALYLPALVLVLGHAGIGGAAALWAARMAVVAALRLWLALRLLPG